MLSSMDSDSHEDGIRKSSGSLPLPSRQSLSGSSTSGSAAKSTGFESSRFERWMNTLLCRGDLAAQRFDAPPVGITELFRYGTQRDRFFVCIGVLFGIISGCAQPLPMLLQGKLADVMINYGTENGHRELWSTGYSIVAVNAALGVVMIVATFIQYYCLRAACRDITTALRGRFIASVLRQDAGWFDTQKFGHINSQLNENINLIRDGIAEKLGLLVRGLSMFLTMMIFSFVTQWRISLSMIAVAPLTCLAMSAMARLIARSQRLQQVHTDRANALLHESIINVRTVQSCCAEEPIIQRYSNALKSGRWNGILAHWWNGLFDGIHFLFLYFFFAVGLYCGAMEWWEGRATAGDVLIVTSAIVMGTYFLGVMSPHIMSILKARVAAALIYRQIERIPEIDATSEEGIKLVDARGSIEFRNVHFAYPNRKNRRILQGVSWEAQPGEMVALVGHSGCGKSTSMGLLTRLYEATGGSVCVDGMDVRSLNIKSLRRQIGIVQQEPVLFGGTIFENIALGDSAVDAAKVEKACRRANAHEFILKLEKGYHTTIGCGGVQLSGGQKQRIAIARAIVNDPPILLLDEATSALDSESEVAVQQALREASYGRTTLIIAHRLSTLRDVGKILVMKDGLIVERGSHNDLLRDRNGLYAQMVRAQQFDESTQNTLHEESKIAKLASKNPHPMEYGGETFRKITLRSSFRIPTLIAQTAAAEEEEVELNTRGNTEIIGGLIRLYANVGSHWPKMAAGTLMGMLRGLELPFYVLLMYFAFKIFQHPESLFNEYLQQVKLLAGASMGTAIWCLITIFLANAFYGWGTELISDDLKISALKSVLKQDATYFDQPETANAKLIQRINTAGAAVKAAMDIRLFHVVNNAFCTLVLVVLALIFSWETAAAGIGVYAVLVVLLSVMAKLLRKGMAKINMMDDTAKLSVEIIENSRTIQLCNKEDYFLEKFISKLKVCDPWERKVALYDAIIFGFTQSFMFLSDSVCYGVGLYLIHYEIREAEDVFASCQFMGCMSWCLLFISIAFVDILHAVPAADSICDIIDAEPLVDANEENGSDVKINGNVVVDRVSFAYPSRRHHNAADGLSLRVECGETIALVGPSGCGKSTIISLLERFYNPKCGLLSVDAMRIDRFKLSALRRQMALVGQEPVLFSGSIYENICLGVSGATREDVVEACRLANAARFIERLPDGYDTEVGEKGAQLSGGQKQRIAIARALIRKPKILLLDEATSALDAKSERSILAALEYGCSTRACITVAHRLSSIQHADRIYFIDGGHVAEMGTHAELLARDGAYARLIRKQNLHGCSGQ